MANKDNHCSLSQIKFIKIKFWLLLVSVKTFFHARSLGDHGNVILMEKSGIEEIQNGTVYVHIETQQVFEITGNTQHLVRSMSGG